MEYNLEYYNEVLVNIKIQATGCAKTQVNALKAMQIANENYLNADPITNMNEIMGTPGIDLIKSQRDDAELLPYIKYLEYHEIPENQKVAKQVKTESQHFALENKVLFHFYYPRGKCHKIDNQVKQLVIPLSLRDDLLRSYHDSITACHQSVERTYSVLKQNYFWHSMYKDISSDYVKSCLVCQQSKRQYHAKNAPLQPLSCEEEPFSRILRTTENRFRWIQTCSSHSRFILKMV